MQLHQDDYQQAAIHEASHAVVAVTSGFFVFGLMLDGPDFLPGAVWRHSPEGMTVETSRDCARRELAIMVAGYLGEREFYGHNRVEWIENGDRGFIDYAALQALEIAGDLSVVQQRQVPAHLWRTILNRELSWGEYDRLISVVEDEVAQTIRDRRTQVEQLARRLLASGYLPGREVYEVMNEPWPGQVRSAAWSEIGNGRT